MIEAAILAARDLPERTWFELTAISGNHGWIGRLVDRIGSRRILYGTDIWPFDRQKYHCHGRRPKSSISHAAPDSGDSRQHNQ